MFRFDNYSRDENFFSATILPYLFSYNDFDGLKNFLSFLNKKLSSLNYPIIDLHNFHNNIETIQIIPEANIDRDLSYYKIDIPSLCFSQKKTNSRSIPDFLIIYSNWAIMIEVKFFMSFSAKSLYDQMEKQNYILDIVRNFYPNSDFNTVQVALVPLDIYIKEYPLLLWQEIYEYFCKLIPPDDYFMHCLKNAIRRYEGDLTLNWKR